MARRVTPISPRRLFILRDSLSSVGGAATGLSRDSPAGPESEPRQRRDRRGAEEAAAAALTRPEGFWGIINKRVGLVERCF